MRSSRPITVTLGEQQKSIDARLNSGTYGSASEVLRAALRALDREDAVLDEVMRQRAQEALDDPRPSVSIDDVFSRLRGHHAAQLSADEPDA